MDDQTFNLLRDKHGREYAMQQRWQQWVTGAFDAGRKPGVLLQLYTDYKPTERAFKRIGERHVAGMGIVELWEPVGDGTWHGVAALLDRGADQAACMAAVKAMLTAKNWPLIDPEPAPAKPAKKGK